MGNYLACIVCKQNEGTPKLKVDINVLFLLTMNQAFLVLMSFSWINCHFYIVQILYYYFCTIVFICSLRDDNILEKKIYACNYGVDTFDLLTFL